MTYVIPAPLGRIALDDDRLAQRVVGATGLLPLALLAMSASGRFGLRDLATHVLLPSLVLTTLLVRRYRLGWTLVVPALVAGLAATGVYDLFRFGLLGLGVLPGDPIPHIGDGLQLRPAWIFGYVWRYVGDGGGLALAFFAIGLRGVRAGVCFGLVVCAGLLATLALTPLGQEMLFPLTFTTVVMATGGHVLYGAVLGALAGRRPAPSA